jgi:hypothetical protein
LSSRYCLGFDLHQPGAALMFVRAKVPKVDGQVKCSFGGKEDAASVGAKIKKAYPIVVVTVVDTKDGTTEIIRA